MMILIDFESLTDRRGVLLTTQCLVDDVMFLDRMTSKQDASASSGMACQCHRLKNLNRFQGDCVK